MHIKTCKTAKCTSKAGKSSCTCLCRCHADFVQGVVERWQWCAILWLLQLVEAMARPLPEQCNSAHLHAVYLFQPLDSMGWSLVCQTKGQSAKAVKITETNWSVAVVTTSLRQWWTVLACSTGTNVTMLPMPTFAAASHCCCRWGRSTRW